MPKKPKNKTKKKLRHFVIKPWNGKLDLGGRGSRGKGKTVFIFGKRGTGKSVVQFYLTYMNHKKFYLGIGMSNVESSWRKFEDCFPKSFVFEKFNEESISKIMAIQKALSGDPTFELDKVLMDIDDCSAKKGALTSDTTRDLFMTGRHKNITVILAVQYLMDITPDIRMNTDIILVGRESNKAVRKRLFENFFDSIFEGDFHAFCKTMNHLTNDYKWMVLNNCGSSTDLEDCLFVFKAPLETPSFRVGHRDMWLLDHVKRIRKDTTNAANFIARGLMTNEDAALAVMKEEREKQEAEGGGKRKKEVPKDAKTHHLDVRVKGDDSDSDSSSDSEEAEAEEERHRMAARMKKQRKKWKKRLTQPGGGKKRPRKRVMFGALNAGSIDTAPTVFNS